MHPRALLLAAAAWAVAGAAAAATPPACAPGDAGKYVLVAENALARGQWARAGDAYACAAQRTDDPGVVEQAVRTAFDHGQLRDTESAARRWLALDPGSEEARRFLATSLLRQYRDAEAAGEYATLLAKAYPSRPEGYLKLLETLSGESNDTGAARVMETLAAADPGVAEAQYARGMLWLQASNGPRALQAVRLALELRPGWRLAQLAEVRALLQLGHTEEGLARGAELAADGDPLTRLNLAWLLAATGRDQQARAAFEVLRATGAATPQTLAGLGTLAFDRHDDDAAARDFSELARISHGDETALSYLGRIAERQGKPALAVRYFERVVSGPRAVASQLDAYRLSVKLGCPDRAELALDDYLSQSPDSLRGVVIGRANQLADAGQPDAGLALMRRASALYPDDDDLRLSRAFLLERLDRVAESVAVMRDVLTRRPDDPTALNSLGYTLVDRTEHVAEGYELVRRALAVSPDSYAIMDSAGWGLYRLGRNDEARDLLERAWKRSQDPEVAAHLGAVLWSLGRQDEARSLWRQAGELDPDNRTLRRILKQHPG